MATERTFGLESNSRARLRGAQGRWALAVALVLQASVVHAQVPPPPAAAPPPPPPAAAPLPPARDNGTAGGDALSANPELEPTTAPAEAAPSATPAASADAGSVDAPAAAVVEVSSTPDADQEASDLRALHSRNSVSLWGSTGLLRTHFAGSGPVGTFRVGIVSSFFGASGFLCPQCEAPDGGDPSVEDHVQRVEAHVLLSGTPLPYLEGYIGIHSSATSNDRGDPKLLQVLGDTSWGVKGFMPYAEDQVFTAGGAVEAWFLNGTGGVGIGGTSLAIRGLGSADFSNKKLAGDRIPLRLNLNINYIFDNSGKLIRDVEKERRHPISRIERYGLNVNYVDRLTFALGAEGMFEVVRPFFEVSFDLPSNRQGYSCVPRKLGASDTCMDNFQQIRSLPSRMTLGGRAYGPIDGLSFFGAFDIGLGGVGALFWQETQPEAPWNLWFGLAYAADTQPRVVVKTVRLDAPRAEAPPTLGTASGVVVDQSNGAPVAGAILRFEGRALTGMVANDKGQFTTAPITPGQYSLAVSADDYDAASCNVAVALPAPAASAAGATPTDGSAAPAAPPAAPPAAAPVGDAPAATARCELKAKPKVGNIEGTIVDAATLRPLTRAQVTVTDGLGRSLNLEVDERGAFRFENVPPGKVTLRVEGENHLPTAALVTVVSRKDVDLQIPAFVRPATSNSAVAGAEVRLKRPIQFADGLAEVLPESRILVDDLAALLVAHPEVTALEVQAHVFDAAALPGSNLALSTERANALRDALIARGVNAARLRAQGFGDSKRLAPGDTDASRARNERVVFAVVK